MKRIVPYLILIFTFFSCDENNTEVNLQANITFNFLHSWDGANVTNSDFNTIKYTNANGQQLSISKLRYLISKITFTTNAGEKLVLNGYNLVDLTNNTSMSFMPINTIPLGNYSKVSFIFGFNNQDNSGNYQDLNATSWNVPAMLGGGYHYMQLEGKFINNNAIETGYAYHTIRAVDNTVSPTKFQDTFFEVNLGAATISNNTTFNVQMNIAEWFKNPNTWDLNVLNNTLMPNFNAQVLMFENGQNVFSLKSIER